MKEKKTNTTNKKLLMNIPVPAEKKKLGGRNKFGTKIFKA